MTEALLYEHIAQYLRIQYPELLYHFDLSGIWTPSHRAKNLYGRINRRAWPDLFIARPTWRPTPVPGTGTMDTYYPGLFIELKRDGTRIKKRDGSWASPHVEEQAAVLEQLAGQGYIAQFAVGFHEAREIIDSFMETS